MDIRHLDPHALFIKLFRLTLEYRLKENLFSRVGAWVGYLGGVPGCVPGWVTWVGAWVGAWVCTWLGWSQDERGMWWDGVGIRMEWNWDRVGVS